MDWSMIIFFSFIILIFVICGVQLLRGKWLMLIAGYNTTSKEEREKINGKALGKLTGTVLIICSFLMLILALFPSPIVTSLFVILVVILAIGTIIYANTSDKFTNSNKTK